MKTLLVLISLCLLLMTSWSFADTVTNGLTIPVAHPRLFWTPARITQAQQWSSTNNYTGISSAGREDERLDLLFSCVVLGNSTACTNAINDAVNQAIGCDFGAVACNGSRYYGEWVALTYDWLYDQMTPTQRSTISDRWVANELNFNAKPWGNEGMPNSNFFYGKLRNSFEMGVAFMGHDADALTLLNYSLGTLWPALTGYIDGPIISGGWREDWSGTGYGMVSQEGTAYGRYAPWYNAVLLPSSKILGRNLFEESTFYQAEVLRSIYATMPMKTIGRDIYNTFAFADTQDYNTNQIKAESYFYGDLMQSAANEWPDTNIGKYAREFIDKIAPPINAMHKAVDPGGTSLAFSNLPLDYYSSGSQHFYIRNNWTSNATSMLWQLGYGRGGSDHIHVDAGSFQVFRKGSLLARETVGYSQTIAGYNGSETVAVEAGESHNVPFIGGKGPITAARPNKAEGPGSVTRIDSDPNFTFAAVDLTETFKYPGYETTRGNQYVDNIIRELYYFRGIDTLVVADRIKTVSPSTSTAFLAHCENNFSTSGSTATCVNDGQEATYTALLPASPTMRVVAENSNGGNCSNWQYRLESENSNPGNIYSYNIYVIEFSDQGASQLAPSIVDSNSSNPLSGTFIITLDASNSITINKGLSSSGGSITAAGITKNLENGKEVMTVTDAGPVWSGVGSPTCNDGVQNGDEAGVDCGGSCGACQSSPLIAPFVYPPANN